MCGSLVAEVARFDITSTDVCNISGTTDVFNATRTTGTLNTTTDIDIDDDEDNDSSTDTTNVFNSTTACATGEGPARGGGGRCERAGGRGLEGVCGEEVACG